MGGILDDHDRRMTDGVSDWFDFEIPPGRSLLKWYLLPTAPKMQMTVESRWTHVSKLLA